MGYTDSRETHIQYEGATLEGIKAEQDNSLLLEKPTV